MRGRYLICVFCFSGFLLAGCGSDSGSSGSDTGFVQLINGVEDSPAFTAEIQDSEDDVVETITSLGFEGASPLLSLTRGAYEIDIFFEDPESGFDERFLSTEVDVTGDTIFTAVLSGTFDDAQVLWLDKLQGDVTDSDEEIEVVAINLSADSAAIHLGDEDEATSADNLVATLAAGTASAAIDLVFDEDNDYRLRVVQESTDELVFDTDEINIFDSARYTLVVTDSTGPDPNTKSAFLVTDSGATQYDNAVAQSAFLLVDAVADAGTIDAAVSISASGDELLAATLMYTQTSDATNADANFVDVVATTSTDAAVSYSTTVSLNEDTAYSFVVAGDSLTEDVSIRANERDLRRVANSVNIHFVNTLTETDDEDSSEVDLYALKLGDSLSDTAPVAVGIEYLEGFSDIIGATPYDLVVTTGGTQSILAGPARIFPEGGERIIVIAGEAAGGGLPNQLSVVADD